jgi:hypothetical protein
MTKRDRKGHREGEGQRAREKEGGICCDYLHTSHSTYIGLDIRVGPVLQQQSYCVSMSIHGSPMQGGQSILQHQQTDTKRDDMAALG